jgi:hypothetical protein
MLAAIHSVILVRIGFVIFVNALIGYLLDLLLGHLALEFGLYPNVNVIRSVIVLYSSATSLWAFLPQFPINTVKKRVLVVTGVFSVALINIFITSIVTLKT